jgi:hypothetical protein
MPLTAQPPEHIEPRLKLFMYGEPGVGKTMAAIQFPNSYIIDAERGTDHYADVIRKSGSVVLQTTSHNEVVDQLRALLSEKHEYKTLVIDPISTIYSELLDQCEKKVGEQNARHFGEAQKHMKRIANLLTALDMNIVVTAHAKPEYGPNLIRLGMTFDGWRRLPYVFDVVVHLVRDGQRRMARVEKSRIPSFPDADYFEWNYDAVRQRYDAAVLERSPAAVALAEPDQVRRVQQLLAQLSPERLETLKVDRWFSKAGVSDWTDMPAEVIEKCISRLEQEVLRPAA